MTDLNVYLSGYTIAPAIIIGIILYLAPRSKDFARRSTELVSKLPSDQIGSIDSIADSFAALLAKDKLFYRVSGGYLGAIRRIRVTDVYLQLTWAFYREGYLTTANARYIWSAATLQILYTVLAAPEAAICSLVKSVPHVFSYLAFDSHRAIALRCEVAFASSGANDCTSSIKDLL